MDLELALDSRNVIVNVIAMFIDFVATLNAMIALPMIMALLL